ncbi:unnamed protein product [Cuscuta europaea]|uniref:Reverse transcriptase Ty1/copia-type domain-containing protein n=1 Tax=Cuscuta europaea TaxID=41803 RepID=A0A9P0ZCT0_CUSEU|nr:unnamed protein product [Cuscuta europaea]
MHQPPGFVHPEFPTHICRLRKALYGLKQASRAWSHLLVGFYILLYVDAILITGSSPSLVRQFITILSSQFSMKDLDDIYYLLGIRARRTPHGLFLSQQKYTTDLLGRFHIHTVKPVRTPLPSRTTLSFTDGDLLSDCTEYRSMVGALQYLTIA